MLKIFKSIFQSSALIIFGVGAVACNSPKIIPDDKLAEIFRDAYITNAYAQNNRSIDLDSLNIYEPILAEHGYSSEDLQFTIGNFAKRKSARMSDAVDTAIGMLETKSKFYKTRVAIHESIGQIARERYAKVVYSDTLISVRRIEDTAKLNIRIPLDRAGTYDVSYYYRIDSTDLNQNLRVNHYLLDEHNSRSSNNTRRLKRLETDRFTGSFTATENHRKLILDLNGYAEKEGLKRPNFRVDSLVVKFYLPDREAREAMAKSYFDYRLIDSLSDPLSGVPQYDPQIYILLPDENGKQTNIVPLPSHTPRVSAQ